MSFVISGTVSLADTTSAVDTGEIVYNNGSNDLVALPLGNIGDVLTVNAAGTEPEWAAPSVIINENFAAVADGTFNYTGTSAAIITGWTEDYDTGIFDDSTGVVTVATAGRFHVSASLELTASGAGANSGFITLELVLDPNGTPSILRQVVQQPVSNTALDTSIVLATDVELSASDEVALRLLRSTAVTGGTDVSINSYFTMSYFSPSV